MGRIKELLEKGYEYNIRERANIYAGATLGALAPIVACRYLMFPSCRDDAIGEAISWTVAVAANVGCSLFARGVPLLYTTGVGMALGTVSAIQLKEKRLGRERSLEQQLQTEQTV